MGQGEAQQRAQGHEDNPGSPARRPLRQGLVRPDTAPEDPTAMLRGLLELEEATPHPLTGDPRFTGLTPAQAHGRVFGGQVLSQCLAAASRTVEPGRDAHSLHGYFVRPGDALTARLPVRSGADTRELVWPAGSGPFAFLRLARPPRLGDAEAAGVTLAAPGLAAPVLLPDPGGR